MLDLKPAHLVELRKLLSRWVPQYEVRLFGSRVTGAAKRYSDIDLVVMSNRRLDIKTLAGLTDALSESDLPYHVDIVEWGGLSESLKGQIVAKSEVIQRGG